MMDGPGSPGVTSSGGAPHVRRLRTLKRKKEEKDNSRNQVKLERVLGLTVSSNASLATAPATGNSSPDISYSTYKHCCNIHSVICLLSSTEWVLPGKIFIKCR